MQRLTDRAHPKGTFTIKFRHTRQLFLIIISIFMLISSLLLANMPSRAATYDWLQFDFDSQHSGNNTQETSITAANVSTLTVAYHATLPSIADGAPAYLSSVLTPLGVKNVLFLNTKDGRILALDAANGSTIWPQRIATGPRYTTSSPPIDPNRLYVYAYQLDGKVHKFQVGDGTEITTGGWPEVASLKTSVEKGSAALSIVTDNQNNTYLYVANGGYPGDAGDYQGHVTAINLADGTQKVFNMACSDQQVHFVISPGTPDCPQVQNAVWARPGVIYDKDSNKIYASTGNGQYNANTGGHNWGDSIVALNTNGAGQSGNLALPLDSYTPSEFQQLQNNDADLGSTAPAVLPAFTIGSTTYHLGVQSGKDAQLRLLNMDNLSGMGGPGHLDGHLQKINLPQGGVVLTQPAVWQDPATSTIWVFVANDNGISGLPISTSGGTPHFGTSWTNSTGGTSPIVVNNMLFYASSGGMKALNPTTGAQLWSDSSIGGLHWESPIVVNGMLFITDESLQLWAYSLPSGCVVAGHTCTPTPSPTNSRTPTRTQTATSTATSSRTPTRTPTATTTPASTATMTLTPSPTNTPGGPVCSGPMGGANPGALPTDTIGLYDPTSSQFYLRNSNSAGTQDFLFQFGPAPSGLKPISGDWINQGKTTVGLFDSGTSTFYLKLHNSGGNADFAYQIVPAVTGRIPLSGDWIATGVKDGGEYDSSTGTFYLRNSNSTGSADTVFQYGPGGTDLYPIVGDWFGQGHDTVGLYSLSNACFYLKHDNAAGSSSQDLQFQYGPGHGLGVPVVGHWVGGTQTSIGVYVPADAFWYLKNTNASGTADIQFQYGPGPNSGWLPVIGHWGTPGTGITPPTDVPTRITGSLGFVSNRDRQWGIYKLNGDNSHSQRLTVIGTNPVESRPAWSVDGKQIAFVSDKSGNPEIYVMNADGSSLRRLTYTRALNYQPAWSPDGKRIAFVSNRDNTINLYVMDSDGSNVQQLTHGIGIASEQPAWSPDGKVIAYATGTGTLNIAVMNDSGSKTQLLTQNGQQPAWSPDGTQIAFASTRNGNSQIYVMNADGSNVRRLTDNKAQDETPIWSPDGTQIAFASTRNGNSQIYVMNADGSNAQRLTNSLAQDRLPVWLPH